MLASVAGITGGTAVEARPQAPWVSGGPGGGFTHHPPKRRCTKKRPCSRMPELPFFPGEVQPMPRGGRRR